MKVTIELKAGYTVEFSGVKLILKQPLWVEVESAFVPHLFPPDIDSAILEQVTDPSILPLKLERP